MPKYVIERNVAGAGAWNEKERQAVAQKSNGVLHALGPEVVWQQSYVVDDKIYCVYVAKNKGQVLEHAKRSGFPADRVTEVRFLLDPASAE